MSELQRPEQTSQDAPDATGGVSHAPNDEIGSVTRVSEPVEEKIAGKREDIRAWLAGGLTILFMAQIVAIGACGIFCGEEAWMRIQEFAQITFGTVAGLMGSAIGFYFGSQR